MRGDRAAYTEYSVECQAGNAHEIRRFYIIPTKEHIPYDKTKHSTDNAKTNKPRGNFPYFRFKYLVYDLLTKAKETNLILTRIDFRSPSSHPIVPSKQDYRDASKHDKYQGFIEIAIDWNTRKDDKSNDKKS